MLRTGLIVFVTLLFVGALFVGLNVGAPATPITLLGLILIGLVRKLRYRA